MWAWREAVNNRAGRRSGPGGRARLWAGTAGSTSFFSPFLGSSSSGSAALLNFSSSSGSSQYPGRAQEQGTGPASALGLASFQEARCLEAEARPGAWGVGSETRLTWGVCTGQCPPGESEDAPGYLTDSPRPVLVSTSDTLTCTQCPVTG